MGPTFKLTSFNERGTVEPIRMILAYSGKEFEDVRIEKEKWTDLKESLTLPFGEVPILEFDNNVLSETRAIARYLANEFGIAGNDRFERAKGDMIVDGVYDIISAVNKLSLETDETKKEASKKSFVEVTVPSAMKHFSDILVDNSTGTFVGEALTWADLVVAYGLETLKEYLPEKPVLDDHHRLNNFYNVICSHPNIKAYLEKRAAPE